MRKTIKVKELKSKCPKCGGKMILTEYSHSFCVEFPCAHTLKVIEGGKSK
ncbi:hypothetical protein [Bacillus cereus]|nr:hypothetical protein [Bacillus cereus]